MTLRQAVKKLDAALSKLIRARDPRCFTCGSPTAHAGHFVLRGNMSTRFDPRNIHGQCVRDNLFLHGNLGVYAVNLDKKYGQGFAEKLIKLGRKEKRWETKELVRLIEAAKQGMDAYEKEYFELCGKPFDK